MVKYSHPLAVDLFLEVKILAFVTGKEAGAEKKVASVTMERKDPSEEAKIERDFLFY
jgi:hypothetical protein